ncbi:Nmad5 family putative nucleotide modification protein [Endozoicomonas sp. ALE010]|uniref:Nmad5 family putative nucleotide modification protein n=1 Tax=Endozoicomonas sp. ALE010 TaxID=3403081 RepID=UPI003BB504C7
MKLSKAMKSDMLVNALETLFGKEMDKLNSKLTKLVEPLLPLYEKELGPWREVEKRLFSMSSSAYLQKLNEKSYARKLRLRFADSGYRKLRFTGNLDKLAEESVTLAYAVPYNYYESHRVAFHLDTLLKTHPAKLKRLEAHEQKVDELLERIKKTRWELNQLLQSCTTDKHLMDAWPEGIEKGVLVIPKKEVTANLPIAVHNLNEIVFGTAQEEAC